VLHEEERPRAELRDQALHGRVDPIDHVADVVGRAEALGHPVHRRHPTPPSALGRRVSKSRRPTHRGRTAITAMRVPGRSMSARNAPAASSPRYRLAAAAYAGATPSTSVTVACPRIVRTSGGQASVSIVTATDGLARRARRRPGGWRTWGAARKVGIARSSP